VVGRGVILSETKDLFSPCLARRGTASEPNVRYASNPCVDFKEGFDALQDLQMIYTENERILLTEKGFVYADIISTTFVSESVRKKYYFNLVDFERKYRNSRKGFFFKQP
jgi:hypothetical protein